MKMRSRLFTSESVSEGHPDKICDQVSDAVLDGMLALDAAARGGIETLCTKDYLLVAGEARAPSQFDAPAIEEIARGVVRQLGYDIAGFNWSSLKIDVRVHTQSPDIARGVDAGNRDSEGAGDQGMMFGYACDETPELMPAAIHYSHEILRNLARVRKSAAVPLLLPDSKSQITVLYENDIPKRIETIVVSSHHRESIGSDEVRAIVEPVVRETIPAGWIDDQTRLLVNPTGRFVVGGPESDTGLTGRKIIVDTYGGAAPHGGGAFSGKDPTKVDRSAAYAARYLAKNVVAAGLAKRCQIQLAYAIGVPEPVSVMLDTGGTATVDEGRIAAVLTELVDLRPRGIIRHLGLDRPIYFKTAAYGHFGRSPEADGAFSWERTDLVPDLRSCFA